jgi:valyl-tRNA synthetase
MTDLPKKLNHSDIEKKWQTFWEEQGTYHWDPTLGREDTFSIDTPPPTVSGSLHIGHVFSYTHTDLLARYQRMNGKNVFYPMGWDDNGLPTERRVQNIYGINCNPKQAYDPNWTPQERTLKPHEYENISRQNFIETCAIVTQKDEAAFESLWRQLGLSVDWNQHYVTAVLFRPG